MIRKSMMFKEEMLDMISKIQSKNALPSFTAAVHFAVASMYAKDNPAYMALKANETPEERVARKKAEKEAKENMFREDQLAILEELGGKLETKEGNEVCVYYTYSGKKRFEQTVSLNMLSSDLVKTQYQPNRTKVEELQAQGKTDYKK